MKVKDVTQPISEKQKKWIKDIEEQLLVDVDEFRDTYHHDDIVEEYIQRIKLHLKSGKIFLEYLHKIKKISAFNTDGTARYITIDQAYFIDDQPSEKYYFDRDERGVPLCYCKICTEKTYAQEVCGSFTKNNNGIRARIQQFKQFMQYAKPVLLGTGIVCAAIVVSRFGRYCAMKVLR